MIRLVAIAVVVAALVSAGSTWIATSQHYVAEIATIKEAHRQEVLAEVRQAADRRAELSQAMGVLAERADAARAQQVIKWKTITNEVQRVIEKPMYSDCRLDADGVRLFNAAAADELPAGDSASAPSAVPAGTPKAQIRRPDDGPAAGDGRPNLRALPRLP